MQRISDNYWQMSSAEKDEVIARGEIDGIPLTFRHQWVEYEVGYWSLWFV